ncbi:hypothetical protein [Maribacter halichondriae]|uniref:hypothetical protein n=1 Tax=Maribacter halichondriae TaxID=2980554 RepID=UPI0023581D42|nr:hypothetical protein [Maribacter sp. Hal144]
MGGEGSMASAIVSLRQNRALLKRRNIKELKDLFYEQSGKTELEFKKASPEELAIIKNKIRKRARKAASHEILLYLISFICLGSLVYLVYLFFFK